MNWFERYGIPGGYFVALMGVWFSAFYREDLLSLTKSLGTEVLAALIGVGFLPIGYILSITTQLFYLKGFGLHRKALKQELRLAKPGFIRFRGENEADAPRDEAAIEARTLLLTVLGSTSAGRVISVQNHQYIRNWISRRMDVMAINSSLILANLLGLIIGLVVSWRDCKQWAFFIFVILVILALVLSVLAMRRQITQAIGGIYRVYR